MSASLVAAAQKEGSLNWYTVVNQADLGPTIAAFNKLYPGIKVNALRLSSDKVTARVLTEQKAQKYNADVITATSPYVDELLAANALQPFTASTEAPVPAGLDMPDGYPTIIYGLTYVIAYNPQILKQKGLPVPTSFEDFTKPEWKGQFSANPNAVDPYAAMVQALGHAKAQQLYTEIGNNDPRLVTSSTEAMTGVLQGDPPATIAATGGTSSLHKAQDPATYDFVNPVPLPTTVGMIDLVKKAPHPDAAKLFIDWMVSQAGQQEAVVKVMDHTSLRTDVQNDETVWNPSSWKPAWAEATLPLATLNTYTTELKAALRAPAS